jgi:hypothetical protein
MHADVKIADLTVSDERGRRALLEQVRQGR